MKEKIIEYFKNNRESIKREIMNLLPPMIREKTVNVVPEKLASFPYLKQRGEEYRVAGLVESFFNEYGIRYNIFEREKGRTNIIGILGSGKNSKKLLMACHLDIVPPGDGWEMDPFEPVLKDGKIYGRGVLDNKGPLVSSMIASRVLMQIVGEDNIDGELLVAGLADEEASAPEGDYGIGYLLDNNLIKATYAIIPDIGENMRKIDVAEKGRVVIKIQSKGIQAHGATPERGINAIYPLARIACKLENFVPEHKQHTILGNATLNLGEFHGGSAANIVPGECSAVLDIRTVPGQTLDNLVKELEKLCADSGKGKITVQIQSATEPHEIDPDNILVKTIQKNTSSILKFMPEPYGLGGGTFAKTLNNAGIKAVGFGPGDDTAFHVANEFVEIDQLVDFACVISLVSLDLL